MPDTSELSFMERVVQTANAMQQDVDRITGAATVSQDEAPKADDTCATCTVVERCPIYRCARETQIAHIGPADFGCKWHWLLDN